MKRYEFFPGEKLTVDPFTLSRAELVEWLCKLRWKRRIVSPFDKSSKIYDMMGKGKGKYISGCWRCANTQNNFNLRTGTVFSSFKLSWEKWFKIILAVKAKKNATEVFRELEITYKTAWIAVTRIRTILTSRNTDKYTLAELIQLCFEYEEKRLPSLIDMEIKFIEIEKGRKFPLDVKKKEKPTVKELSKGIWDKLDTSIKIETLVSSVRLSLERKEPVASEIIEEYNNIVLTIKE